MKIHRPSRRMLLQGVGGALLAIPFLESLLPRGAHAAYGRAKRFIAIKSYSTQNITDWYPTLNGNGYSARPNTDNAKEDGTTILTQQLSQSSGSHSQGGAYHGHEAPLADFAAAGVSNILGTGLNPFLSKMLLLRGLDFLPHTNHNHGGMLGNFAGSEQADAGIAHVPTIDQVLAYSNIVYPTPPAGGRSLHMRLGNANTFSYTHGGVAGGQIEQVQAHTDPLTAYNQAFGNVSFDPMEPEEHPNLVLLDRVHEDYAALRSHRRLGAADKQLLERHMQGLSELHAKLEAAGMVGCSEPTAPGSIDTGSGVDVSMIEAATSAFVDVIVAAVRCDVTRVFTLDIWKAIGPGAGAGGSDLGFVHSGLKDPVDWHEFAHGWGDASADAKVLAINTWIANDIFGRLLAELDVPEDGDGSTYLDNSVVMWGNELGFNHLNWSIPTVLAGGAGGMLETGRYIDYIDWNQPAKFGQNNGAVIDGVPYNRLLVTLLRSFGLQPADYEPLNLGEAGYGSTSTAGKTFAAHAIDYDFGEAENPLPDIFA
jgi:hypothetical protein